MKHKKRIAARKLRQQYLGSTVSTPLAARPSLMAKAVSEVMGTTAHPPTEEERVEQLHKTLEIINAMEDQQLKDYIEDMKVKLTSGETLQHRYSYNLYDDHTPVRGLTSGSVLEKLASSECPVLSVKMLAMDYVQEGDRIV